MYKSSSYKHKYVTYVHILSTGHALTGQQAIKVPSIMLVARLYATISPTVIAIFLCKE